MKRFLVIGGTSGIGLETSKLLSNNNHVVVISREKKTLTVCRMLIFIRQILQNL